MPADGLGHSTESKVPILNRLYPYKGPVTKGEGCVGWRIDRLLILVGIVALLASLGMNTSVPSAGGGRIHNIGLMNEKQNYLIVSGIVLLIGVLLNISNRRKTAPHADRSTDIVDYAETKKMRNSPSPIFNYCPHCNAMIDEKWSHCQSCGGEIREDRSASSIPESTVNIEKLKAEIRLQELKNLFDKGLITVEEYERKRAEILDEL